MQITQTQSGFTLLEVLLYSLIASTLLAAVSIFIAGILEGSTKQRAISLVESEGAHVIGRITQLVRNAEAITSPSPGATSSVLVMDVVDGTLDPTTIDLSGDMLRIDEGGGSPEFLTSPTVVTRDFVVTNRTQSGSPGTVQIAVTIATESIGGRSAFEYEQTFYTSASIRYD